MDEMRQRLLHVWRGLKQSLIDDAVDQRPTRLRAGVHANGGHFEHILSLSICILCTWWTLCFTHRFHIVIVHYKCMKCSVSFSQGSISPLFRWDEHVLHVCAIIFLLTAEDRTIKIKRIFPELWTYCHVFYEWQITSQTVCTAYIVIQA